MGRKHMSGLVKRNEIWHINKVINGRRICESTGSSDKKEVERYLVRRLEEIRQAAVYGVRPKRSFRQAALKFVQENTQKASLSVDVIIIKSLDPYIGHLPLEAVHMGSLQAYIEGRQRDNVKTRTINYGLQVVRRILNLAASEWLDEYGLTWLVAAPKIKLLRESDKRKPYPMSWEEQNKLFAELPAHLRRMALFAVNSGCRDKEVCELRWEWEVITPIGSVFIIPGEKVKNRDDRLVVLNCAARAVIEEVRGQHPTHVFIFRGKPVSRMLNSAWKKARIRAGLPQVRVHDLKHTFGRRLRAAGVSFEDRQDLLGHRSGRITTHYSAAELRNLIAAADMACEEKNIPSLVVLRGAVYNATPEENLRQLHGSRAKVAQGFLSDFEKAS